MRRRYLLRKEVSVVSRVSPTRPFSLALVGQIHRRKGQSKSATGDIVGVEVQWSSVLRIELLDHLSSETYATQRIGRLRREDSARHASLKSLRGPHILYPQCGSYPHYAFSSWRSWAPSPQRAQLETDYLLSWKMRHKRDCIPSSGLIWRVSHCSHPNMGSIELADLFSLSV
jgi:hypothetical protein